MCVPGSVSSLHKPVPTQMSFSLRAAMPSPRWFPVAGSCSAKDENESMNVWSGPRSALQAAEYVGIAKLLISDGSMGDGGVGSGVGALSCEKAGTPVERDEIAHPMGSSGRLSEGGGESTSPRAQPPGGPRTSSVSAVLQPDVAWGTGAVRKARQQPHQPSLRSINELLCGKSSQAGWCVSGAKGQSSWSGSVGDPHHSASSHLNLLGLRPPQGAKSDRSPVLLMRLRSHCHSLASSVTLGEALEFLFLSFLILRKTKGGEGNPERFLL